MQRTEQELEVLNKRRALTNLIDYHDTMKIMVGLLYDVQPRTKADKGNLHAAINAGQEVLKRTKRNSHWSPSPDIDPTEYAHNAIRTHRVIGETGGLSKKARLISKIPAGYVVYTNRKGGD